MASNYIRLGAKIAGAAVARILSYLALGPKPSSQGRARFSNTDAMYWRNAADSGDVRGFIVDASNNVIVGDFSASVNTYLRGGASMNIQTANYGIGLVDATGVLSAGIAALEVGNSAATTGRIRVPNASGLVGRNAANSGNLTAVSIKSDDSIQLGDAGALGVFIPNMTAPGATPVGGGFLYVEGGALKFKGSGGTVTTIAPA